MEPPEPEAEPASVPAGATVLGLTGALGTCAWAQSQEPTACRRALNPARAAVVAVSVIGHRVHARAVAALVAPFAGVAAGAAMGHVGVRVHALGLVAHETCVHAVRAWTGTLALGASDAIGTGLTALPAMPLIRVQVAAPDAIAVCLAKVAADAFAGIVPGCIRTPAAAAHRIVQACTPAFAAVFGGVHVDAHERAIGGASDGVRIAVAIHTRPTGAGAEPATTRRVRHAGHSASAAVREQGRVRARIDVAPRVQVHALVTAGGFAIDRALATAPSTHVCRRAAGVIAGSAVLGRAERDTGAVARHVVHVGTVAIERKHAARIAAARGPGTCVSAGPAVVIRVRSHARIPTDDFTAAVAFAGAGLAGRSIGADLTARAAVVLIGLQVDAAFPAAGLAGLFAGAVARNASVGAVALAATEAAIALIGFQVGAAIATATFARFAAGHAPASTLAGLAVLVGRTPGPIPALTCGPIARVSAHFIAGAAAVPEQTSINPRVDIETDVCVPARVPRRRSISARVGDHRGPRLASTHRHPAAALFARQIGRAALATTAAVVPIRIRVHAVVTAAAPGRAVLVRVARRSARTL